MHLYKFRSILLSLLLILLFYNNLYCQDPPIEWGVIPRSDLEMKSYPADSNASAVILCDYGQSNFNNSLHIIYDRITRIKILNKNGYDKASVAIKLYTKGGEQSISDIEGITYSLDDKGQVVKKELDDDQVFEEEINDNYTLYKFTMPGITPGCIIEYRYKIQSESLWDMQDWTFQWDEPVEWSEYRVCFPQQIVYSGVTQGYDTFFMKDRQNVSRMFTDNAAYYLGTNNAACTQWRWIIKNAPAIRDEPFVTTVGDYKDRVSLQLAGYLRGTGIVSVLRDWKSCCNDLIDAKDFGKQLDDETDDVEDLSKKITEGLTDSTAKMKAIYNWVKNSIVWNGNHYFYSDVDADDLIDSKKGDDADINFLLIALLRSAGLKVDPVVLSTRSHGKVQVLYPIISQFNYIIAKVNLNNKTIFLDATDPLRSFDLLPKDILGVKGLVVQKDNPQWVSISSDKSDYLVTGLELHVNDDGSVNSKISSLVKDYGALDLRKDIAGSKDYKEYAKKFFDTESKSLNVDSVQISEVDSLSQFPHITAWVSSHDFTQQNGDMMYLNPQIIRILSSNPIKSKERKFPLDISNKVSQSVIVNMIFPVDYEIKNILPNRFYKFGDKGTLFSRQATITNNVLQIVTKFNLNESIVDPDQYEEFKKFFGRIINCESEVLVLEKKKEPAKTVTAAPAETNKTAPKSENHIKNNKHANKK